MDRIPGLCGLLTDQRDVLLQQSESNGWIVLIVPGNLNDRTNLLSSEEYLEKRNIPPDYFSLLQRSKR